MENEQEVTEEERASMWDAISNGMEPVESQNRATEPAEGDEQHPEEEAVTDPWDGVSPAIKESFENMASKVNAFDAMAMRLKQAESRIGALQNKISQAPPPEPTAEEKKKALEDDRHWQTLKEDFPEWADEIERRSARTESALKDQREKYALAEQALKSDIDKKVQEIEVRFEKASLSQKYPEWENIITTKEYTQWLGIQPSEVKDKTRSVLAKDAISVLDKFTKDKLQKSPAVIAEERKQRLSASVLANGSKARAAKSEYDMTDDEYREYIAKQLWEENKR
jgi:hypothetical protein